MSKYILQADALKGIGEGENGEQRAGQAKMTVYEARSRVEQMKTIEAIPADTIVRCGKCKWYCYESQKCLHPAGVINPPIGPMFYCKNGEAAKNKKYPYDEDGPSFIPGLLEE